MAKLVLTDITNLQNEQSVVNAINANNAAVEAAIENTLSRDGTTPNPMNDDLDMNSNRIYNLPEPVTPTEPLRREDAAEILSLVDEFQAAVDATADAVEAYESIQALYLGEKTVLPTTDNLGGALQSGALVSLVDQPDPDNDGLYVYHNSAWEPVGILPAAFERVEYILATAGQTSVSVPNGYSVGTTKVFRNGALLRIGGNLGLDPDDDDVTATDGTTLTFPATVLEEDDLITVVVTQAFAVGTAINVGFVPAGTIASTNVQSAIEELDSETQTALGLKAPIASPTFTGTPAAPTATAGTSTTQLATTAFVTTADNLKAPLASPAFTGVPTAPTAAASTNTTQIATTAFVQQELTSAGAVGLQLIATGSNPGSSLDLALGTTYRRFVLKLRKFEPVTAGAYLRAVVATDGVPTYLATNYSFSGIYNEVGSATVSAWQAAAQVELQLAPGQVAAAGRVANFDIEIENSGPSAFGSLMWRSRVNNNTGAVYRQLQAGGECTANSNRWTHIRFNFSTGNIAAAATWALYGYEE